MNMEEKNKLVIRYIDSIKEYLEKNGYSISDETYKNAIETYTNSPKTFEEIKMEINKQLKEKIDSEKRKNKSEILPNPKDNNRDNKTYSQVKKAYEEAQILLNQYGLQVFLTGGLLPYILLDEDSHRLHDDVDTVCRMEDMSKLRTAFQIAGLYDPKWDSLSYSADGLDYGFEVVISGVPFGMHPFTYEDGTIVQHSYDPYNQNCKIKNIKVSDISDYVVSYQGKNGKTCNATSLEIVKKSKIGVSREKDHKDLEAIDRIGVRNEVMSRIGTIETVQSKPAQELTPIKKEPQIIAEQTGPKLVRKMPENKPNLQNNGDGKINLSLILIIALLTLLISIIGICVFT